MSQVEILKALKDLKKAIFLSKWESEQCQVRIKHATEEVKEMQLVHITKELQVWIRAWWPIITVQ